MGSWCWLQMDKCHCPADEKTGRNVQGPACQHSLWDESVVGAYSPSVGLF